MCCDAKRKLDGADAEAFELDFEAEDVVKVDDAHGVDDVDAIEEDVRGGGERVLGWLGARTSW